MQSQSAIFQGSGYPVITASTPEEIHAHTRAQGYDIAILNHTLSFADRKNLAQEIKEQDRLKGVLILHASGVLGNPHADVAVDSRGGAANVLRALERVDILCAMRAQHANEDERPIVVVDPERNYVFANEAACRLVGFDHAQFMELRIDDLVAGKSQVAGPLFERFVSDGSQIGAINLRHRSGRILTVKYWAEVRNDGYMMARWEPLSAHDTINPAPSSKA
jgi:PAS domain-containing protein